MQQIAINPTARPTIEGRVNDLFSEYKQRVYKHTDRLFAILMAGQWLAGIISAFSISPRTWVGASSQIHLHVWAAIFLGSAISFFPIALALIRPGKASTRYAIAAGQMLMGALLIHLNGGRIEMHFHIFGSLAFLAFYRDWRVLVPATLVVVLDHLLRGVFYPQSIFGVLTASNWRWLEHAGWVFFIDIFLVISCLRSTREMRDNAERTTALETGEERYRFFRLSLDMLCIASLDGYFKRLNPAFEEILGFSEAELLSKSYIEFIHPEDRAATLAELQKLAAGEVTASFEIRFICQNGTYKWLAWTVALVPAEGLMYAVARDVTERRRMEADVARARDVALESVRLKSEFLANMSHEIRTPMNGVIGMTGLLLDTGLSEEQRDFADTIRSSGDALLTIINDILDFSKIEAGKLHFEIMDFDLRYVIEDTLDLFAHRAHGKQLELASLIYGDVQTALRGDPGRLRQVLTNLIGNAVKFTERGEVIVHASLENETSTHSTVRFAVSDTGIGISEAARRDLFQAFVQADGSTTRKYGGTGLGLAISKQLVEMMGGEIGVNSTPEQGSTFWFTTHLEKQSAETATSAPVKGSLHAKRVLIVDDNATNRKILVHQTLSWGMIPVEAESGQRAIELLRAAARQGVSFDLAILDLMMPEMDGFEVARTIKADESIASVRLMMLTSYGERGHGEQAREAGVLAYLTKPVRQVHLFDCLTNVMGQTSPTTGEAKVSPADSAMLITKHSLSEAKTMSDKRILVAEDNTVNQKVTVRQLKKLGYTADVAANGREAFEALEKIVYAAVLMDCQMPEMDGYEATAAIRAREGEAQRIPIIAMTAHALEGERAKCLAAGMDDYLSKPVRSEELSKVLERWMSLGKEEQDRGAEHGTLSAATAAVAAVTYPVDVKQLMEAADNDPALLQSLADLYVDRTTEQLASLRTAIEQGAAAEVYNIAHKCLGGSATCGMTAVVASLSELERKGRDGELAEAEQLIGQAQDGFNRIKEFLEEHVKELV